MKNRQKDITSFSIPSLAFAVFAWIFTPDELASFVNPFIFKIVIVIVIASWGFSFLLLKWLIEKKNAMKENEERYNEELNQLGSQLEVLNNDLKEEKSKYSTLDMQTQLRIESLSDTIEKQEKDHSSAIQEKQGQINNLKEQIAFRDSQIAKLEGKLNSQEISNEEKLKSVLKEKYQLEKARNRIKTELETTRDALDDLLNKNNSFENMSAWRHTVLIIDDNAKVIKDVRNRLNEFPSDVDIVYMKRLEDYRLVENFEIIISDILKCSPGDNATLLLNTIKERYPYKFVFAMSTTPAECEGLNIDGDIIQKENTGVQYIKVIKSRIIESIKKLDDPKLHWEQIENTYLKKYANRPKKMELLKNAYITTIRRLSQTRS